MIDTSTLSPLRDAVQRGLALSPESAAELSSELETVTCRGGEWLFRQGDAADGLYLLVRGRMQVWIDVPNPEGTGSRLAGRVAPGETIGEIGMLAGGVRSAGIRAMRDSLLLKMDTAAFDRSFSQRRPELTRQLAGGIATRLRDRTAGVTAPPPTVRRGSPSAARPQRYRDPARGSARPVAGTAGPGTRTGLRGDVAQVPGLELPGPCRGAGIAG